MNDQTNKQTHPTRDATSTGSLTSDDSASNQPGPSGSGRPNEHVSAPIEITPAPSGKFGVLRARPAPDPSSFGPMIDANGEPVPIDKIIRTANTMSNILIAHKIALDDDFRLEPGSDITGPLMSLSPIIGSSPSRAAGGSPAEPSLQSRVKDIVHDAYWDLYKEELESQKSDKADERRYDVSRQLIMDIKQKILELLLPQHSRLKQDLEEKLDGQMIDQLIKVNSLNLIDYARYILAVLSKLCAPVRDDRLRELNECTDVVQLYRGIMELLELMRLDFANFTINQFKPHIKAHSADYEREKFNEILKQQKTIGIDGLEFTRIWLERAVKKVDLAYGIADLVNEANMELTQEDSTSSGPPPDKAERIFRSDVVNKVLNTAYCELLEWSAQTQKLYPETLLFDEATFKQLAEQYRVLLLTSSLLITTFAFTNRLKIQESNEFKVLIKSHIITLLTATYDTTNSNQVADATTCNQPANSSSTTPTSCTGSSVSDHIDQIKLETVACKLVDDIKQKIRETNESQLAGLDSQFELFKGQIMDLQVSSNRVRELARRRILEFVETLLVLDIKHQQKQFSSKSPPPVNIPLGLNCLADEITLTMAQLVKFIRYNRKIFFQHYQDIIIDLVSKVL